MQRVHYNQFRTCKLWEGGEVRGGGDNLSVRDFGYGNNLK